jgi:hypothetical protein|tara:strand:+ start:261 stop:824 length:564 start_codon:yes stop_codon:yes gene_type:complete
MKNALVYTEDNKLWIRKPSGLNYEFENVDKPELGFDYEVLIYDDIEVKVEKWDDSKGNFDSQVHTQLTDAEVEMIEMYISNSEPPIGVTLAGQYTNDLGNVCKNLLGEFYQSLGFDDLNEVVFAGREGSNHPYRSNARRVMEYGDAIFVVFDEVCGEIHATREDHLKEFGVYESYIPNNMTPPDIQR